MIGVVVPARNEVATIAACLDAIAVASAHPGLGAEPVRVVVVADSCEDGTAAFARALGAVVVVARLGSVGASRRLGAEVALKLGARWLASTDADSEPEPGWLAEQLALHRSGWDAVCGLVRVEWADGDAGLEAAFAVGYNAVPGHRHVHGASLGVSAEAYRGAGGWSTARAHEDVRLVDALIGSGFRVARSAAVVATTSGRLAGRVRGGFADHLAALSA